MRRRTRVAVIAALVVAVIVYVGAQNPTIEGAHSNVPPFSSASP
jgi:hypothetical protein